jgi:secreted PhoX family phosphatase
VMFEGFAGVDKMTKEQAEIEMAAHGGSVIEVKRGANGNWKVVKDSKYNRRITARTTMELTGPAAGSDRLKTRGDAEGRRVRGMLNNCAGAVTPWGTWLTCEENFNNYFGGALPADHPEAANYARYGITGSTYYAWSRFEKRFDLGSVPNEANRFGWVVEIDPKDPQSTPKKRTAMGRFKHEGAANIVNKDGRFVVYQGDDQAFDYVYRFVTKAKVDLDNPAANTDILDEGTLYVARFDADGTGRWIPLIQGRGPLTAKNGFTSQADVVICARLAADLLGATKMDRPEDVEANPKTDKVYVMLTNNTSRTDDQVDAANPRPFNAFGHIIEITPDDRDHAAETFRWDILVKCGDPSIADVGATFNPATSENGWFGMPDNCAIDSKGRLWIATDGNSREETGRADGLWAMETKGALRGTAKHFFRVPVGAEMCGPCFTPDDEALFLAVQHPGTGDDATFAKPLTRWPDFVAGQPPRPSVLVVTRNGGGKIA